MALYLVEYTPLPDQQAELSVPAATDLPGLARHALETAHGARWLTTFSPDLHDDRQFSLWEAPDAESIQTVMSRFGFLSDGLVKAFAVRQWGPEDVISEQPAGQSDW
jgi:hypothetical protein